MNLLRNGRLLILWLLGTAALCLVIGLLGALGPSIVWFGLAVALDAAALLLVLRRRA